MSLQTFLDSCKNISEINNVIAEEPTDAMMAQITSNKYTFTEKPTLFRFNVTTDSKTKNINVMTGQQTSPELNPILKPSHSP
jgi:hypothetical protein